MMEQTKVIMWAMGCIAAIEIVALIMGIDGQLFAMVAALIAGLAGYLLPSPLNRK